MDSNPVDRWAVRYFCSALSRLNSLVCQKLVGGAMSPPGSSKYVTANLFRRLAVVLHEGLPEPNTSHIKTVSNRE